MLISTWKIPHKKLLYIFFYFIADGIVLMHDIVRPHMARVVTQRRNEDLIDQSAVPILKKTIRTNKF